MIAFFKEINCKHGTEVMVQVYWDKDNKKYFIHCPEQTVSKASISYKRDIELDKKCLLAADFHSHNTMGSFFSGTDDGDEKQCQQDNFGT